MNLEFKYKCSNKEDYFKSENDKISRPQIDLIYCRVSKLLNENKIKIKKEKRK